jgi:4'-phosphopantetheinyl transferase
MNAPIIAKAGARIDVSECRLDTDADIALADAYGALDNGEQARAASFVFERDRDRFVRAHGHLRRQLGVSLGIASKDVPLVVGDGGKPFVEGHRVSFSLSHSGSHAVVAITQGGAIGIDLETLDRSGGLDDQLAGLSKICLTREEQYALSALPPEQRVRRFLSYWTAKEARMKLTGDGMTLEPHTIALKLSNGRPVGYLRPRAPDAELCFIRLSRPDAICCLAARRSGERILAEAEPDTLR